jgi:sugar lactone lactonase YvrE
MVRHRGWPAALTAVLLALAAVTFLVPATARAASAGAGRPGPAQPAASPVQPVADLPGQFPESITIDRWGNMYLGLFLAGTILKITPSGHQSTLVTFPSNAAGSSETLGVRVGPDGNLYAAVANTDSTLSGVWRVSPSGHTMAKIATVPGFPNGLAFDARGNLYVSESIGGAVYRISLHGGPAQLWSDDPLLRGTAGATPCGTHFSGLPIGANGLAFDSHGDLLVNNTTESTIVRIPVRPDGTAGPASLFVRQDCRLWGADGVTTDRWGNLYVAANAAENIVRVSPTGRLDVLASHAAGDPLFTPSDVAFGPGWLDRPALFISNFALAYPNGANGGVVRLTLGPGGPPRR